MLSGKALVDPERIVATRVAGRAAVAISRTTALWKEMKGILESNLRETFIAPRTKDEGECRWSRKVVGALKEDSKAPETKGERCGQGPGEHQRAGGSRPREGNHKDRGHRSSKRKRDQRIQHEIRESYRSKRWGGFLA